MSPSRSLRSNHETSSSPFLLRLFYRRNSFYHVRDFRRGASRLPRHLITHVEMKTTLEGLVLELASVSALPSPATGTMVAFQLLYHDFGPSRTSHRAHKATELGSVIIGAGGSGVALSQKDACSAMQNGTKTLEECNLYIGDYINCVVLPPLHGGSVASLHDLQHVSQDDIAPEASRHASSPSYYREKSPSRARGSKTRREQRRRAARKPDGSGKKDEMSRRRHDRGRIRGRATRTDRYPDTRGNIDRYPAVKVNKRHLPGIDRHPG